MFGEWVSIISCLPLAAIARRKSARYAWADGWRLDSGSSMQTTSPGLANKQIAITGKMCSGKSTIANMLKEYDDRFKIFSFGNKIKLLANELFDMDLKNKDRCLMIAIGSKMREIKDAAMEKAGEAAEGAKRASAKINTIAFKCLFLLQVLTIKKLLFKSLALHCDQPYTPIAT